MKLTNFNFKDEIRYYILLTIDGGKLDIKKSFVTKDYLQIHTIYGIDVYTDNYSYDGIYRDTEYQLINGCENTNASFVFGIQYFIEKNCDLVKEYVTYFGGV